MNSENEYTNRDYRREYKVLRLHDEKVDILEANYIEGANGYKGIKFESDLYSTYAIVYKDTPKNATPDSGAPAAPASGKDAVPKTGDTYAYFVMLFAALSVSMVGIYFTKKFK